jgi:4a-hydroxytetrahydrobiopterin dehydratase
MKLTALTEQEIQAALAELPGWTVQDGQLHKQFRFANFARALGWMVSVGVVADKLNHHPDWSNVYNRVTVNLSTHDLDGAISQLDVTLASKMESLAA